jgi:hypothetical protein
LETLRRYRISALFCALAVAVCEAISHPIAEIGIGDDWSYTLTAEKLAATGHIVYNGWGAPILGWQLFWGAGFVKLFGASYTSVRLSEIAVAMALAFVLQRTLVRCSISERNATLGTLAFVLSPLYLLLSTVYMTDIPGLFALVVCLYGCLRALQAGTDRATIDWLIFAALSNALLGTTRQIAWLGVLVMVPSTLWLLRDRRRVLLAGAVAVFAGVLVIAGVLHWFGQQPYAVPEHIHLSRHALPNILREFTYIALDIPFLLLPISFVFLAAIRRCGVRTQATVWGLTIGYTLLAQHLAPNPPHQWLEPAQGDWVNPYGLIGSRVFLPPGDPKPFLPLAVQILLTLLSIGGLLGFFATLHQRATPTESTPQHANGHTLRILLLPFTLAYVALLVPRAENLIFDRYSLALLVVALVFVLRFYEQQIQPDLPSAALVAVLVMAAYGVINTHNVFAFYRARIAMADELHAAGLPDTAVDFGWEVNLSNEIHHAPSINDPNISRPANIFVTVPEPPLGPCWNFRYSLTPHLHAVYGVSFSPNACAGPAPFAPVTFSRWLDSPVSLYVVRYATYPTP